MAISDELNRIILAKAGIKSALEEKGLTIGDSSTLDEYPALILEMEVGGGGGYDVSTVIDLIEGDITSFEIPLGTTRIKAYYFDNCHNLENIIIPNTVTNIGLYAFLYCDNNKFTKLNIPNSVTTIGMGAFQGTRITFFDIPEGVTDIEGYLFSNGRANLIKLPSTITNIKNNAFLQTYAETILLAKNVPTLGSNGLNNAATTYKIYVPGDCVDSYKNAGGNWNNVSTRITALASMSYDSQTYTVTALGRDNLELYVDASLCNSSVYTFPIDNRNHTIEVKSVDPSLGLLDSSTMNVYIGEPQYMALTCSDPNGATVSMTLTLGNNSGVNVVDMKYSTDGTNWNNWAHTDVTENDSTTYTFNTISLNEGDKVYFKGNNSTGLGYTTSDTGNAKFVLSGNLGASGNVMSLLYDDDFLEYNSVPINGLSNLFNGCTSLTTAPELPATTLGANCYRNMFYGCTSLTTAPELPAITLGNWCYSRMFYGCTSLNYVKAMFTAQDAATHTQLWLNNVSATGTFVKNPEALWSESDIIPSGWIVEPFDYTLTPQTYQAVIPAANLGYALGVVTINADDYNNNDYVLATKISGWPPYDQNGQSTDEGEITPIKITLYEAPTGTMTLSNGSGSTLGSLTQDANNPLIYWYNITNSQQTQEFDIMLNTANEKFKVSKVEFNYNEFSE